MQIKIDENLH